MKKFIQHKKQECEDFMVSCALKRIEQVDEAFKKSDEYAILNSFYNSLYKNIKDIVPKDKVNIVNEHNLGISRIMDDVGKYYYNKGFGDGIALFDVISDEKYKKGTILDCMKEIIKNHEY